MSRALRYAPQGGVRKVAHRTASAAECIGPLSEGVHVTGLTAGQFSSIDALEHIVNQLGPCFCWVSTWTTGLYDVQRASELVKNQNLLGVRMLLDRGTFEKSPKFAGPLIAALGVESFRCMAVHAKVSVFVDPSGQPIAVMRSSMNLNKNLRTEQFDISVDSAVSSHYAEWFETLWDESGVGTDNQKIMQAVFDRFSALPVETIDADDDLAALVLGGLEDE